MSRRTPSAKTSAKMTARTKHATSPTDETARDDRTTPSAEETVRDTHTADCDAPKALSPHEASCDIPHDVLPDAPPAPLANALTDAPASEGWYTATLRAIVNRALDADKPDIKGALAALQLLAETDNSTAGEDLARTLREARRRVLHAKQTE